MEFDQGHWKLGFLSGEFWSTMSHVESAVTVWQGLTGLGGVGPGGGGGGPGGLGPGLGGGLGDGVPVQSNFLP